MIFRLLTSWKVPVALFAACVMRGLKPVYMLRSISFIPAISLWIDIIESTMNRRKSAGSGKVGISDFSVVILNEYHLKWEESG